MIDLFFSLSSSFLFILLFNDNEKIFEIKKENHKKHSENFVEILKKSLEESNLKLKDVRDIYFTTSPGGQTGIRVTLSFMSAMKILSPRSNFYMIDSLSFQAGESTCISMISNNIKGTSYSVAWFEKGVRKTEKLNVKKDEWEIIKKTANIEIKKDFESINFSDNFFEIKYKFKTLEDVGNVNY